MSYWVIWLMIVILLIIIEAMTVNLVSAWFIASGIVSLFVSLLCDSFFIQFGVFVLLGILLLIFTRASLLQKMEARKEKTNLDLVLDKVGIVTQKITKNTVGEVKVDGKFWSAISDRVIPVDAHVLVKEIQGVKLVVEKIVEETEELPKKKEVKESSGVVNKSSNAGVKKKGSSSEKKKTSTKNGSTKKVAVKKKESE